MTRREAIAIAKIARGLCDEEPAEWVIRAIMAAATETLPMPVAEDFDLPVTLRHDGVRVKPTKPWYHRFDD